MGLGVRRTILIGAVGALAAVAAVDAVWRRYAFPEWLVPLRARFQSELSTVRPDHGIDAREAEQIAHLYMLEYISGCGAPMEPRLHDGTWTFPLRLGFAGRLSDWSSASMPGRVPWHPRADRPSRAFMHSHRT